MKIYGTLAARKTALPQRARRSNLLFASVAHLTGNVIGRPLSQTIEEGRAMKLKGKPLPACVATVMLSGKYSGSLHIRSADKAAVVVVRVLDDAGTLVFEKRISDLSSQWRRYEFEFKAVKEAVKAIFQVGVAGTGEAVIDAVSLFSKSALDGGGFRPDLLAEIAEQKPATIRYPGGSFASRYQ
ncbi:MAG: hypothetical protein NTW21_07630 [Verrucomicrobia bacterium]|nr:hypothetical protein [Verrucomicrobiota bacterium]